MYRPSIFDCETPIPDESVEKNYNEFVHMLKDKINLSNEDIDKSRLIKLLNDIIDSKAFITTLRKGKILYRARNVYYNDYVDDTKGITIDSENNLSGFNEYESKEPPLWGTNEARNNIAGISYLYLASNAYTACSEVRPMFKGLVSVANFEIKSSLKLLDFSKYRNRNKYNTKQLCKECHFRKLHYILVDIYGREHNNNINNYSITQFISDYIRKSGFDGIAYRSPLSNNKNDIDYTIFNCCKNNVSFISSKLYCCTRRVYDFSEINNQEQIKGQTHCKSITEKELSEYKNNVIYNKQNK